MILSCPNCGTQYVVKDGAIPAAGRQVRCASCKHRWHQDPEDDATPPTEEEGSSAGETSTGDDETIAEASLIEPRGGPDAEERAYAETLVEADAEEASPRESSEYERMEPSDTPAQYEEMLMPRRQPDADQVPEPSAREPALGADGGSSDDFSPFAPGEDDAPRRRSPLLTLLLIALIVAAIAAAFSFLAPPEWKARVGLGSGGTSPLAFVITHRERQQLQSGNQLLTISGRIVNPTSTEQVVPPIKAQLKTREGRVIYSWTIAPPTRSLAPGKSASFNSAEVNVPPGGDDVTITTASGG
jgi:predicted Zn finger-like uncharacterized protein